MSRHCGDNSSLTYLKYPSFSENAENLCKENLELAMAADGDNAEVYHLYASYFISKGDMQVFTIINL